MRNQLKNLFNSKYSELSMLAIIMCLVIIALSKKLGGVMAIEVAAGLAAGIILVVWLAWSVYVLATRMQVTEMEVRSRLITESCSCFLILCWLALSNTPVIALVWAPFCLFTLYRSIKDTNLFSKE